MTAEGPRQSREEICVIPARRPSCAAWTFGVPALAGLYGKVYRRETSRSAAGSGETIHRPTTVGKRPLFLSVVAEMKRLLGCRGALNREARNRAGFQRCR